MIRLWKLFKGSFKSKAIRGCLIASVGFLLLFFIVECGLNLWIRSGIHRSLAAGAYGKTKIVSRISWLGLSDILAGRVNRIHINAKDCLLSNLRYSRLVIDSEGFRFNLRALLKEKRLRIIEFRRTRINGVLDEQALNEYLNFRYPEYQSSIEIKPGGLILSGSAHLLNRIIPVRLEGNLKAISEKKLRFYPTRLLIANNSVSGSLLRLVSEQVPLEFGVMEDWPLRISGFQLEDQKVIIAMEEIKTGSR